MSGRIITGAAGSGKTDTLIGAILAAERDTFWNEIWVLLPNRLQSEAFRDRLIQRSSFDAVFNVRFFSFYELYDMILDLAGQPQRTIGSATSDRILRHVIDGLSLDYYDRIANKAGFVKLVSGFIKELKQGMVGIEDFERYAATRGPKDRDIARIYTAYQELVSRNGLIDRDGAGWVAYEEAEKKPEIFKRISLLAVDGFDNFNPLQARLLGLLGRAIPEAMVSLHYEEHRAEDTFRSFARTLDRLQQYNDWKVEIHDPLFQADEDVRHESLAYLETHLFRLHSTPLSADGALHLIEAPDASSEARAVLRDVKQQILNGISPEHIAIAVRDTERYMPALRGAARAYGIPVAARQAEHLLDNPAIRTILNLFDLHTLDFPRRQMLDLLMSPYLDAPDFTPDDIDALTHISLERPIVRGQDLWLSGIAAEVLPDEEGEVGYQLADGPALAAKLSRFFERITPPPQASARDYAAWIENLLGADPLAAQFDRADLNEPPQTPRFDDFGLYRQIRAEGGGAVAVRDLYAMLGFRSALQEVLEAYELLASLDGTASQNPQWATFRADLELAMRGRTVNDETRSRIGRVLVTSVHEARGLGHQQVYVMGLSEGIFPIGGGEDPLYGDAERDLLEREHGIDVQTRADRNKDDGLFYEMVALPRQRLVMSRPTLDDGGNLWQASPFWKAVADVLSDPTRERVALGVPPALAEAANGRELLVRLARNLAQPLREIEDLTWGALGSIIGSEIWRNVAHGVFTELRREDRNTPFDAFGGILQQPELIAQAAEMLHPQRKLWSATQLNELGQCGFRFFSRRMLKLEPYEDPVEGLDRMQLGSVNHKILEDTYAGLEGVEIAPENLPLALDVLQREAERVFAAAPREFGFQATLFWQQEQQNMLRKLEQLIRLDFSEESPVGKKYPGRRVPYQQEAAFGDGHNPPLMIGELQARGYIDRMDAVGDEVIIIDYKSGASTPSKRDMEDGKNFQMLLYLLAAQQILQRGDPQKSVGGGLFWSITRNKDGGYVHIDDEALAKAQGHLQNAVQLARRGWFANRPAKLEAGKCASYCDFSHLCRVNRASSHKPLPTQ